MTTIRTTCPECGEVDMSPESILLSLQDQLGGGSYRFSCPECRGTVEKSADRKIVALLLSAGVGLADDCSAGPVQEASHTPRPAAPPFTVDDVLAFRALLNDDELLYRSLPGV